MFSFLLRDSNSKVSNFQFSQRVWQILLYVFFFQQGKGEKKQLHISSFYK